MVLVVKSMRPHPESAPAMKVILVAASWLAWRALLIGGARYVYTVVLTACAPSNRFYRSLPKMVN